ncbi:ABC transporter ATP-binding protein/permease [Patescibacteria group bacterium]|nr:ABC transporter ATP-binding protein/permease [Patescibacteria group bacterium]
MKTNTKKTIKYYLKTALDHKISGFLMIFGIVGGEVMSVIVPLYFRDFFNILASGQSRDIITASLISILITIAILELAKWAFRRFATFSDVYFTAHVMFDLANHCFAYLHKNSFSYFENNFVGSLVKRVKWFVNASERIVDRVSWHILPLIVSITIITYVLFQANFWLGLAVFVWVIGFLLINWAFTKYKLKYDIAKSKAETATTRVLADTITNNVNVKLFNGYGRELNNFFKVVKKFRASQMLSWNLGNVMDSIQGFLMISLEIGTFYLAIRLWNKGVLTLGDFVLIQTYLITIFHRTWEFGRVIRDIYENLADAEEMTEILSTPHDILDVHGAKKLQVQKGEIEFSNVTFCYHKTRNVLKKFNLRVKAGEKLGLVGPSGAGKTTVIKLILRMHDLTKGQIIIDGQDISKVTQESLWQNVSLVPQDPILFHRTLMENIKYGKPNVTNEEVIKAAKAAHCHEFITEFQEGYNTYVGERGVKLSGGERQRVAIARAILRNAPILILDEATSSLDSESEMLIQDALDKLMKDKTVIVVAHRLSTIRKMDRIIIIDQKGILEEGKHSELSKKKDGVYKKLWKLQAGGFIN